MFEGIFPALITPFTKDDKVDEDGLRSNINFAIENGVSGIVPAGCTGEAATLSHQEQKKIIDVAIDASRVPVIPGTGSNNTKEAIELTKYASDAGADAAMLITPYYNKPTDAGLITHYKTVAEKCDIPIILYNVPSRTSKNMSADVVAELAKVENIVGIKEASGDINQVSKIIELTRDLDFVVLSGDDALTLPIMALGGKGVVSVAANIIPRQVSDMVTAFLDGRLDRARELHYILSPLFRALFLETNPIPIKTAMGWRGLAAGKLRPPLYTLSEKNATNLRSVLESLVIL
ncbi:MAG: 4-hydroxy-tetrahydrodipicolinate synthase [Methanocellales archaeon]|nr:4-hydroxy-tetrahydrodipicolinate synthase [Methanocellales archaeon]MDD3291984.1 4-hydroxy-tetrahydrodipicolinate synthase [Methanocellales archaeon]MDD5235880.1 4-hydroxy-tetrahydrodipicolinate synthase [Methanocellales archaeon]MDD5485461.1 4-hydroxy-tetrahydrodipicolinate synthase [Methanocellales archaeon]